MRRITLFLFAALAVGSADAAWYQKTDGTIVDPILLSNPWEGDHLYSGNNLQPGADLSGADLVWAELFRADLSEADLTDADLTDANLDFADLTNADLSGAKLERAWLRDADLSGADLTNAMLYEAYLWDADLSDTNLSGATLYGADLGGGAYTRFWDAFYYTDNEPFWDPIMTAAWRSSNRIHALAPVPEPSTLLLALLGLALLPRRRRR